MIAPPARSCIIPGNRIIVKPDGSVRLCFFHEPVGYIRDADIQQTLSGDRLLPIIRAMHPETHKTCQNCSQFLDWDF